MELDEQALREIEDVRKKYEFLSFIVLDNELVVGVIQNETPKLLMVYRLEEIRDAQLRERFLKFGDEWWWQSNQSVPINAFIGRRFDVFESCLRGYSKKTVQRIIGPTMNLADRYLKRIKKKRVVIVKNL